MTTRTTGITSSSEAVEAWLMSEVAASCPATPEASAPTAAATAASASLATGIASAAAALPTAPARDTA